MDHSSLVIKAARKYSTQCAASAEDLISYGWFGLHDALKKYNSELGNFEPYALRRIYGAMIDGLRREHHSRPKTPLHFDSLDKVMYESEGSETTLADIVGTDEAENPAYIVTAAETVAELHNALEELPEKDRMVVENLYFEQKQRKQLAEELGVSYPRVTQIKKRALETLRKGWTPDEVPIY